MKVVQCLERSAERKLLDSQVRENEGKDTGKKIQVSGMAAVENVTDHEQRSVRGRLREQGTKLTLNVEGDGGKLRKQRAAASVLASHKRGGGLFGENLLRVS